jgi:UDP-glucose 4-epimerase
MATKMNVLVTGGAGYIGGHVVDALLKANASIEVIDDLSSGISARLPEQVKLHTISLQDSRAVEQIFSTKSFDAVIHLAAKKRVGESVERPDYYWQENVGGLQNLFTAMKVHNVKNFVFSSSAAVYGQPDLPSGEIITEQTVCSPINPYGATKLEGELLSQAMAESNGLKVAALRYFNVAGAGRPKLGDQYIFNLVPIVFDALERGVQPVVFGDDYPTPDGSCIRDYVHVQDLAHAHIAAMDFVEKSEPGFTAINIGTGSGASVLKVIEMIQKVTGISIDPIVSQRREGDPAALVADVSFAKNVLGWQSSRDLRDIVTSAWEAWRLGHE